VTPVSKIPGASEVDEFQEMRSHFKIFPFCPCGLENPKLKAPKEWLEYLLAYEQKNGRKAVLALMKGPGLVRLSARP